MNKALHIFNFLFKLLETKNGHIGPKAELIVWIKENAIKVYFIVISIIIIALLFSTATILAILSLSTFIFETHKININPSLIGAASMYIISILFFTYIAFFSFKTKNQKITDLKETSTEQALIPFFNSIAHLIDDIVIERKEMRNNQRTKNHKTTAENISSINSTH